MKKKRNFAPMKHIMTLLIMLALIGCQTQQSNEPESEEPATESINLVLRVSQQSRLYTAEYQVHKIVTHNDLFHLKGKLLGHSYDQKLDLGERKVAIPMDVTLKTYIDFGNFTERNVERSGDMIHITLPDPKFVVTSSRVDNKGIRQFTSLLRKNYSDEEMTDFTRQGVESILKQAPQMGILNTARESAAQTLIPLLCEMGYEEDHIVITFRKGLEKASFSDFYDREGSVIKIDTK